MATLVALWCLFFAMLLGVPPDPDSFLDQDTRPSSASTFSDRLQFASLGQREVVRSPSSKDRKALANSHYDPPIGLVAHVSILSAAHAEPVGAAICIGGEAHGAPCDFDPRGPPFPVILAGTQHFPA